MVLTDLKSFKMWGKELLVLMRNSQVLAGATEEAFESDGPQDPQRSRLRYLGRESPYWGRPASQTDMPIFLPVSPPAVCLCLVC